MKYFGYCRISTPSQNIERQIRNIKKSFPEVTIFQEAKSGTKLEGRIELLKMVKRAKALVADGEAVTLIVDSLSRLSRNAEQGIEMYFELFNAGVEIVSLKEPQCNSEVYRQSLEQQISIQKVNTGEAATDKLMNTIISAVQEYMKSLAKSQIEKCFEQSQKEVDDMRQRTREGLKTAKDHGKQIGAVKGKKQKSTISDNIKKMILKKSKLYGGTLSDNELIDLIKGKVGHCSPNTYYKCKRELIEQSQQEQAEAEAMI